MSKKSEFVLKYKLVWNICLIVKFIRQDQAEELLGKKKIRRGEKALLKKLRGKEDKIGTIVCLTKSPENRPK